MNKRNKKLLLLLVVLAALFLMSGCAVETIKDADGNTVTKLIYLETTFKETMDTESFFNALFVWPMAQFINHTSSALGVAGSIAVLTAGVHLLVFLLTIKSTLGTQRMQMIQPEVQRIQKKYEGKTDEASQLKQSNEIMALYKKYDINPLGSIIQLFLQMPILFAIYHAVQRAEVVLQGSFLGMNLATTPKDGIFTEGNMLYLVLFVFMFVFQMLSMLLPTWLANYKAKKEAEAKHKKYVKPDNPANQMMIMMGLIMLMAFTWPSAMSVYWIISSCVAIFKSLLTQFIVGKQSAKEALN